MTRARWAATSSPSAHWRRGFPRFVPESWGINLGVFTDFGTLGRVDNIIRTCTPNTASGQGTCDKDNLAFRATAGISFQWTFALRTDSDRSGAALRQDQLRPATDHPLLDRNRILTDEKDSHRSPLLSLL